MAECKIKSSMTTHAQTGDSSSRAICDRAVLGIDSRNQFTGYESFIFIMKDLLDCHNTNC